MVFQLVRNTTAIWRNAARYCWFKMDLFVSKLYTTPARGKRSCQEAPERDQSVPAALPRAVPEREDLLRHRALEGPPRPGRSGSGAGAAPSPRPLPSEQEGTCPEVRPWRLHEGTPREEETEYSLPAAYTPACSIPKGTSGCL